jgi:EAL domain-containing protein (putative c-di-GMP-specific phosphodiesterase class I)
MKDQNDVGVIQASTRGNLRIIVVAEGIETVQQQMLTLQSLACDLGQGYLFSKPMQRDEIVTSFPLNFSAMLGKTMSETLTAV